MSMTSRERLITAFHKGKPDRLPIFIRGVNVFRERWVESRHPSYRPLIDYVREKTDPITKPKAICQESRNSSSTPMPTIK